MADVKKKRESRVLSEEEQKQVKFLRQQISGIRNKGRFMNSYTLLRTRSNDIRKDENMTESDKKKALVKLCSDVIAEIQGVNKK